METKDSQDVIATQDMGGGDMFTKALEAAKQETGEGLETPEQTPEQTPEPKPEEKQTEEQKMEQEAENALREKEKEGQEGQKVESEAEKEKPSESKPSKREEFIAKAEKERSYRDKEALLKEKEANIDKQLAVFKEFQQDPVAYLERTDPMAYQNWTLRNLGRLQDEADKKEAAGAPPREMAELHKKIESIEKLLMQTQEQSKQQAGAAEYNAFMSQVETTLAGPEFEPVREYAAEYEALTGTKVNVQDAARNIWAEFFQTYNKQLNPREIAEIMLEDSEANLRRYREKNKPVPDKTEEKKTDEKKKSKSGNGSQKTLTNDLESQSTSKQKTDDDYAGLSKDEIIRRAIASAQQQQT